MEKEIKDGTKIRFNGSISFSNGTYIVGNCTDKAISIDGEWIPRSQLIDVSLVNSVFEVVINDWFDKKLESNRGNGWGY